MPGVGPSENQSLLFRAIFGEMAPAFREAVVGRALSMRDQVSADAANALNAAIRHSPVRAPGYRDPLRAPHTVLRGPVSQTLGVDGQLAGALLRVWADSQQDLRERVVEHLRELGIESDSSEPGFRGYWSPRDWPALHDRFIDSHSEQEFSREDAALMLCYVAGRVPGTEPGNGTESDYDTVTQRFQDFLEFLEQLPASAPQWRSAVPGLVNSINSLLASKEEELKRADDFDALIRSIDTEFGDLLGFFEKDTHWWAAEKVSHGADFLAALELLEQLKSNLAQYRDVHDRAPSISEERDRAQIREELQSRIMELAEGVARLMTRPPGDGPGNFTGLADDETTAPSASNPGAPAGDANARVAQEQPPADSPQGGLAAADSSPASQGDPVDSQALSSKEFEALRSENLALKDRVSSLSVENRDLRDREEALETELFSSQEREDSWRLAYRSAVDGSYEEEAEDAPQIASVNDAVELARSRFRQEMVFAPNSESNIEDNPFTDPQRVWQALQWLGTTYFASRMGRLRVTDFDQSIKEACGWWYKGDQGETTLSRYEKSYTTRVDGKRHSLEEHIGKGTTFDARYTIRIAFDWDRERRQVIVGYIGRHQQTGAS